jgi:hypothetical protein
MPRAAIAKGYANRIVPLDGLVAYLSSQYGTEKTNSEKKEKDKSEKAETISVSHRN